MKHTKILTIEEYESPFLFDKKEEIEKLVKKEENFRWAKEETNIYTPEFKKIKVKKDITGWYNFIATILKENVKQFKP